MTNLSQAPGLITTLKYSHELNDAGVVVKEETNEFDGCHSQLLIFVMNAFEKSFNFLGVKTFIDGFLVSGVFEDES